MSVTGNLHNVFDTPCACIIIYVRNCTLVPFPGTCHDDPCMEYKFSFNEVFAVTYVRTYVQSLVFMSLQFYHQVFAKCGLE